MKKLIFILSLLLCLTLPALAEGTLPDFSAFIGDTAVTQEQTVSDSYAASRFSGQTDAVSQAVDAYLAQLADAGMKQQLMLPLQQDGCAITLYAFTCADSAIPTLTWADAALGCVVSETHLLLDLRIYPDGAATVEIRCRPELTSAAAAAVINVSADCTRCNGTGYHTADCTSCGGDGKTTRNCSTCGGDGQRNCSSCGGDGQRKCSTCSGSGHHSSSSHNGKHHSKSCSSCGGDGQRKCSSCSGSGHRSCSSCSGSGKSASRCGSCSGTGHHTTSCGTCGGTGKVN